MSCDLSSTLASIDERIVEIEGQLAGIAPLVSERMRLLRARSILLGQPEPDSRAFVGRPRLPRHAVFEYLTRHPGSSAGEIAAGLGAGQPAVSAHLYRGKGEVFVNRDGRWYPVPAADPRGVSGGAP